MLPSIQTNWTWSWIEQQFVLGLNANYHHRIQLKGFQNDSSRNLEDCLAKFKPIIKSGLLFFPSFYSFIVNDQNNQSLVLLLTCNIYIVFNRNCLLKTEELLPTYIIPMPESTLSMTCFSSSEICEVCVASGLDEWRKPRFMSWVGGTSSRNCPPTQSLSHGHPHFLVTSTCLSQCFCLSLWYDRQDRRDRQESSGNDLKWRENWSNPFFGTLLLLLNLRWAQSSSCCV